MERDRPWFEEDLLERFGRYVRIHTTSDRHSTSVPSTAGQFDLARTLEQELRELGAAELSFNEQCYLIARFPGRDGAAGEEGAAGIGRDAAATGLLAHLDTSPDSSGEGVEPQVHRSYDGTPIGLPTGDSLDPEEYPALLDYRNETIITSDGSTLLGADDKAGVAEIMTALRYLAEHREVPHGPIDVVFSPDEEIGRGMDNLPLRELRADACYTIDGGEEGTVEAECFNAVHATVTCTGKVIHPGSARGKLANAVTMAGEVLSRLPRTESPEATDGRYGFYAPIEVSGSMAEARVELIIRDFEQEEVDRRISALRSIAAAVAAAFPAGEVSVHTAVQYRNMREKLADRPEVTEPMFGAIRDTGMEPVEHSIRGGTDGARLTEMGIPTPNIFSGAQNMHGVHEWVALPAMVRASKAIINLLLRRL
jgi:tripeptide aminopeptidase